MGQNILRPNQIQEYEDVRVSLKKKLNNPRIQDKNAVRQQLKRVERDFDKQAPKEIPKDQVDAVIKKTDALLEGILQGMPSSEEMRKCPPGAINKHRQWSKRNKKDIAEWKENRLRLNVGTDDPDVANLEMHRPEKSQLNMQGAYITGTQYHMTADVGPATVLSSEDLALIKERAPEEVYYKLAFLDADQRAILKLQYVTDYEDPEATTGEEKVDESKPSVAQNSDDTDVFDVGTTEKSTGNENHSNTGQRRNRNKNK